MNNISIKKVNFKNAAKIVAIHKICVLKSNIKFYPKNVIGEWSKQISVKNVKNQFKNSSWYIIKIKNKIIGFCQFSLKEKTLYQINVLPECQRKNYGKLLYNFIEKIFKKNKIDQIFLNSTLNAVIFYKRLGFKKVEKIKFKLSKIFVKMIKMKKKL